MDGDAFGDGFRNQLLDEDMQYDRLSPVGLLDDEGTLYDHLTPKDAPKVVTRLSVAGDLGSPVGYVVTGSQHSQPTTRSEPQWQYSGIAQSVESVLESRGADLAHVSPGKSRNSSTATSPTRLAGNMNPAFADFATANAAGGALAGQLAGRGVHPSSPDGLSPEARMSPSGSDSKWRISAEERKRYEQQFRTLKTSSGFLSGRDAREFFLKSKLPNAELSAIWKLSDLDGDGKLSMEEFCVAVHIVIHRRRGDDIPAVLPAVLWPKKSDHFDIESAFNELGSTTAQRTSSEAFQPILTRKESGTTVPSTHQGTTNTTTTTVERNEPQVVPPLQPLVQKPMKTTAPVPAVQLDALRTRRQSDPISSVQSQLSGNLVRESKPLVLENPMAQMGIPPPITKDKPLPPIPGIGTSNTNDTDGNSSISRDSLSPETDDFPLMPPSLPLKKKSVGIGKHVSDPFINRFSPARSPTVEKLDLSESLPPPPIEKPAGLLAGDTRTQFVMDLFPAPALPPKKKSSGNVKRSKSQRDRQSSSQTKLKRRASKEAAGYLQLDDDSCSLGDASVDVLDTCVVQPTVHDLVSVGVLPVVGMTQSSVVGVSPTLGRKQEGKPRKKEHSRSSSLDLNVVMKSQGLDGVEKDVQPFTDLPPTPPPKDFPIVLPKRKLRKPAPEPPSQTLTVDGVRDTLGVEQPSPGMKKGHRKSASLDILSSSPDLRDITRHIRSMTPDSQAAIGAAAPVESRTNTQRPSVREKKKAPPVPPAPYIKRNSSDVVSSEASIPKDPYASVNKVKKDKATLEVEIRQLKNRFLELKRLNINLHTNLMELKEQRSSLQVKKEILEQRRSDSQ